jgi:hypothetical protein
MNPLDWLNGNVTDFVSLSDKEREAIQHFSLLWSLFESRALNTNASSAAIVALSQQWQRDGRINLERFSSNLDYFRDRYFKNGNATEHFAGLHLRPNDHPQLVELFSQEMMRSLKTLWRLYSLSFFAFVIISFTVSNGRTAFVVN